MTDVVFDAQIASRYDETTLRESRPEVLDPAVRFLADLAGDGDALEFGIGTGRIALPLSAAGVRVQGIDISSPMLDELRRKPGAERVPASVGDFSSTRVAGAFRLVYLVFNTVTNVATQEEQVACFRNAAAHLEPGGTFVVEVFVPQLRRLPPGERIRAFDLSEGHVGFDEYADFVGQRLCSHHYWIGMSEPSDRMFSSWHRYVWPSELDLMARLAGLTLRERWQDFARTPFTDESESHVSVFEKPARV